MTDPPPPLRRSIEAVPVEHEGKPMFVLRDLEGLTQSTLGVSAGAIMLAEMFDGKRTALEVQALFAKQSGTSLKPEDIAGLAEQLERAELLETPAVAAKRSLILKGFLESPVRPASHVGSVYPADALKLSEELGKFFMDPKGPGKEPSSARVGAAPAGLVCPHIDFHRGGPAYAWAYQALSERRPPDLIVALGVAHMSPNSPWVMTPKNYQTPYGDVLTDPELYAEIKKELWYDPREEELVHRTEHSLEFSAVWLKYLWKEKTPPWVPILCSSFERFCPDKAPSTVPTVNDAISKIGEKLAARVNAGQKVTILAAVDLAHVGPRFGDEEAITPETEARIEKEDRASLEHALKLDADAFYLSVVKDGHWRKVCGLSALYTSIRLIKAIQAKAAQGTLLSYGQAPDPAGGIVSFTSAIYP